MLRWTIHLTIQPGGSQRPTDRPSGSELRGAVYRDFLGGVGHRGWTPWRSRGFTDHGGGRISLGLMWLPDRYRPEREPTPSTEPLRLGSWMVTIDSVESHAEIDRLGAVTRSAPHAQFTVRTAEPVLLTRTLPQKVGTEHPGPVDVLYPHEALILTSLARDWNAAGAAGPDVDDGPSAMTIDGAAPRLDPDDAALIGELTTIAAHRDLRSVLEQVHFDPDTGRRRYQRCFTGSWVMRLMATDDPSMVWWFSVLMN
jgi:hypothetical protein